MFSVHTPTVRRIFSSINEEILATATTGDSIRQRRRQPLVIRTDLDPKRGYPTYDYSLSILVDALIPRLAKTGTPNVKSTSTSFQRDPLVHAKRAYRAPTSSNVEQFDGLFEVAEQTAIASGRTINSKETEHLVQKEMEWSRQVEVVEQHHNSK